MVGKNVKLKLRVYKFDCMKFTEEFVRYGHINTGTTVLLKEVKDDTGSIIASHISLNRAKPFYEARLVNGDIVEFKGLVMRYKKGDNRLTTDFNIQHPLHVRNISDSVECQVLY